MLIFKDDDFLLEDNTKYVDHLKEALDQVFDYNILVHLPGPIVISKQLDETLVNMYNYFFMTREIQARIHKHTDGYLYLGQAKGLIFDNAVNTVAYAADVEELKIIMSEIFASDLVISEDGGTLAFASKAITPMELTEDQIRLAEKLFNMTHNPDKDFNGTRRTDYNFKCNVAPDRYSYTISLNKDSWSSFRDGIFSFTVNGYTHFDYILNKQDFEQFINEANAAYIEKMEKEFVLQGQENEERRNILNGLYEK